MTSNSREKLREVARERRRRQHAQALEMELASASDEQLNWLGELMAHEWRCSPVSAPLAVASGFVAGALRGSDRDVILSEPLGLAADSSQLPELLGRALTYLRDSGLSNSLCVGSMPLDTAFTIGYGDHGEEFIIGLRRRDGMVECVGATSDAVGLCWVEPASAGGADTPYLSAGDPAFWPAEGDDEEER